MDNYLDTSYELCLLRCVNGVKLVRPDRLTRKISSQGAYNTGYNVAKLFKLPFSIYFLSIKSSIQNCNKTALETIHENSLKAAFGKSVLDFSRRDLAIEVLGNDEKVIKSKQMKIFEEEASYKDDCPFQALSIKLPWYNENNQVIGILGCSILINRHPLSDSLSLIADMGLLGMSKKFPQPILPGALINGVYLSKRETEVLQHTIRGKSANRTGKILHISQRTVEYHLETIKNKMGVYSKFELIDKVIDCLMKP